jgi:hypothetical protein
MVKTDNDTHGTKQDKPCTTEQQVHVREEHGMVAQSLQDTHASGKQRIS